MEKKGDVWIRQKNDGILGQWPSIDSPQGMIKPRKPRIRKPPQLRGFQINQINEFKLMYRPWLPTRRSEPTFFNYRFILIVSDNI